jgi:hypothetical protein
MMFMTIVGEYVLIREARHMTNEYETHQYIDVRMSEKHLEV